MKNKYKYPIGLNLFRRVFFIVTLIISICNSAFSEVTTDSAKADEEISILDLLVKYDEDDSYLKFVDRKIVDGFTVGVQVMTVGRQQRRLMEYIELLKVSRKEEGISKELRLELNKYIYDLKRLGVDSMMPYAIIVTIKDKEDKYITDALVSVSIGGNIPQSKQMKQVEMLRWYERGFRFTKKEEYPIKVEFVIDGKEHKAEFNYKRDKILIDHYVYEMFPE